jgi:hypothetical protein
MPKPSQKQSKSHFVRSQPATMSPAEVIAKAKASGITVGRSLVYMVRARSSEKAKKRVSKKTSTAASVVSKPISKSDFVRSLPASPAKDVVAKAKAEGISISENHVHAVRAKDNVKAKSRRVARKTLKTAVSKPAAATNGQRLSATTVAKSSAEELLKAVAAELGLARAVEILAGERTRVQVLIGG